MASAPTATQVLAVARKEIGVRESPPGSNKVKYSAWYGMTGPWCAMFVSWVAAHSGATSIIPKHAYTPAGVSWFKARHQYYSKPRVGDIVYFEWPGMGRVSHVGFVEAVHKDGSITTIEGNTDAAGGRTGGRVMRQRRTRFINGYGRPKYGSGVTPPKPPVVSGEDFEMMGRVMVTGKAAEFLYTGVSLIWIQNTDHRSRVMGEYKKQTGKDMITTEISSQTPIQDGFYGWLAINAMAPAKVSDKEVWDFSKHRKQYV
jgi:surface antigen